MNVLNKLRNFILKKAVQYTMMSEYGKAKWKTSKDYQYVTEAYNQVVWVYSCVSLIANATSSVKWCLYRKYNKDTIEIENHPILTMVNDKANSYTSSKDFFEIWSTYLATQGKFYAVFNNSVLPTSFEFLYPHNVYPIPNLQNFVSGFEYRKDGVNKIYDSDLVLWSKFFDPLDNYEGLSPIKAMARTIDTENEAVDWNKSTLQNNAVPPGAINVVNPSPELQETLREEWLKRYAGANNARVPLILNAEKASYVSFGMSPQDMDFLEQRKLNRIEICSGFGVPAQLVGDTETQTYSNYEQAQKSFWENTIIPKYLLNIKNQLNKALVARYADNLYLEPDLDDIPALQENREVLSNSTDKLWTSGIIKRSEARARLGYEHDESDNVYRTELVTESITKQDDNKKKVYY